MMDHGENIKNNRGKVVLKIVPIGLVILVMVIGGFWWGTKWREKNKPVVLPGITIINNSQSAPAVPASGVVAVLVDLGSANLDTQALLTQAEIQITDRQAREQKEKFTVDLVADKGGNYQLQMKPKELEIPPGEYKVQASFQTPTGIRKIEQNFWWGVLAINPNKAVYHPGEKANLALAVLDETGMMVCDAKVGLTIKSPGGEIKKMSKSEGNIKVNPECQKKEATVRPDYETDYLVGEAGIYQMTLTAETKNGVYTIEDYFEAKEDEPFVIERVTATRIYPVPKYPVTMRITPRENFKGEVRESAPSNFEINGQQGIVKNIDGKKIIVWSVDWRAGETYTLSYDYLSPPKSPDFYLLGPLEFFSENKIIFKEERQWQIAVDSVTDFNDTFTETADKTLATHVPNTPVSGGYTAIITSGTCALYVDGTNDDLSGADSITTGGCGNSEGQLFRTNNQMVSPDYKITVTMTLGDNGDDTNSLACRIVDANNMYALHYNTVDAEIYERAGGSWGVIADNSTTAIADGSVVTFSCIGTTISALDDGVVIETVTDTTLTSAGYAGIGAGAVMVSTDDVAASSASFRIDNFKVTTYYQPTISSVTETPDPANPGRSISFTTAWSNSDTARTAKVKVCKTAVLTDQNCPGGYWATSTDFTALSPVNLTYSVVAGDAGAQNYTVFVCSDEGSCSAGTSGTFTVNGQSVVPNVRFR